MSFFRKYFVYIALFLMALATLAYFVGAFVLNDNSSEFREEQIKAVEINFTKDTELSLYKNGNLLKIIDIEIADTFEKRSLGLMYRTSMKENQGMLFIFPEEEMRSFYMKNTIIPLDIIYLNKDKEIINVIKNARPFDETSLPSEKPAQYVLEISGGLSDKWGIEAGDTIDF